MLIYSNADADSDTAATGSRKQWHSIGLVYYYSACNAARACKGVRFLTADAPSLPLRGCDAAKCKCQYRHYTDRRGLDRRRDENAATAKFRLGISRRRPYGRRADDFEDCAIRPLR